MKISYDNSRDKYLEYFAHNDMTIIDVGGGINCWAKQYVNAIVDFNIREFTRLKFIGNICEEAVWTNVAQCLNNNTNRNKYDFSICTHTLEDLANPMFVIRKLEQISNKGLIIVPSKYKELSNVEGNYHGYIHHRWIFNIEGNSVIAYPKLGFLEHLQFRALPEKEELHILWENNIDIKIVNNDYLGPTVNDVYKMYEKLNDFTIKV